MSITKSTMFSEIEQVIKALNPHTISTERKAILQPLTEFIQSKVSNQQDIRINFICTHNSRRSHLSQVWAQTLAYHFNIKNVFCYSGGTESIKYAYNQHPIIGFSKRLNDDFNPKSEFAAIMTCDSANEACPFVSGAEKRIPITFEDPKAFDNTPQQAEKYNERSLQIATELFYVFSQIKAS
jgi:arsenate reductase